MVWFKTLCALQIFEEPKLIVNFDGFHGSGSLSADMMIKIYFMSQMDEILTLY